MVGLSQGSEIKNRGISGPKYLQPGDHGGAIPGGKGQALAAGLFQKFMPGEKGAGPELSGVETSGPAGWPPSPQPPLKTLFMDVENMPLESLQVPPTPNSHTHFLLFLRSLSPGPVSLASPRGSVASVSSEGVPAGDREGQNLEILRGEAESFVLGVVRMPGKQRPQGSSK